MSWLPSVLRSHLRPGIFARMLGFGMVLVLLSIAAMSGLFNYILDSILIKQLTPVGRWVVNEAYVAGDRREDFLRGVYDRARLRLTLYDASGKVIASTKMPYAPLTAPQIVEMRRKGVLEVDAEDWLAVPIQSNGQHSAYGLVGFADEDSSLEIGPLALLGIFAVVGIFAWPIAASLTRPIRQLGIAVMAFGQGQLDVRVPKPGNDEIGRLGQAFNAMAGRVEDSMRAERLLLAAISHELRTPLQRVRLAAELAADSQRENTQLRDVMADLDDLDGILSDVLAFARLEADAGKVAKDLLRKEPIPAQELVADCAARFEGTHPGRTLQCVASPELPVLQADARLLRRAMANLLSNAARYSASDAPITLEGRLHAGHVVFEVKDRGPGIPPDLQAKIFQPFFRGDEARSAGGSGLGLSIVKRIVEAHGGTVEVHSSESGSTFRIVLPPS